jgi:hypothetical protein
MHRLEQLRIPEEEMTARDKLINDADALRFVFREAEAEGHLDREQARQIEEHLSAVIALAKGVEPTPMGARGVEQQREWADREGQEQEQEKRKKELREQAEKVREEFAEKIKEGFAEFIEHLSLSEKEE